MTGTIIQETSKVLTNISVNQGTSLFPVVFTSLMSYAFQSVGRFYSERGIKLKKLHFLMTIRNTSDATFALKHIYSMPPFIVLSILVWSLSPLGSQASLRILCTTNQTYTTTSTVRYLDTGPLRHSFIYQALGHEPTRKWLDGLADVEMFTALNQPASVYDRPMDSWGNVKVPWIDTPDTEQSNAWNEKVNVKNADSFSSLLGIPIHELPPSGTKDLILETSYLKLACSSLSAASLSPYYGFQPGVRITCPKCPIWNATSPHNLCRNGSPHSWCERLTSFLGLEGLSKEQSIGVRTITIDIWRPRPPYAAEPVTDGWSTRCGVTEKRVEVHVQCQDDGCYSEAIRPSQTDRRTENSTAFDYWVTEVLTNRMLLPFNPADIVQYLSRSSNQSRFAPVDLATLVSGVDEDQFSSRLGAILNAYIQIYLLTMSIRPKTSSAFGWGPEYIPSGGLRLLTPSSDLGQIDSQLRNTLYGDMPFWSYAAANVTTSNSTEVYQPVIAWVACLLICSLTLLAIGSFGIICEKRCLAPKRFEPVLGQTFDNPDFGLGSGGTTLDVDERLQLLGRLEVRVGDTRKGWDVGRIGFAIRENIAPLQLGRLYE
ncbi:hypothetical protein F4779DRAFT_638277 [Xylariaceae sp. FL0662B]|nr:hypothetical protein F4779DRAFT_638277 [Xylariaceae sp. FL0662B]